MFHLLLCLLSLDQCLTKYRHKNISDMYHLEVWEESCEGHRCAGGRKDPHLPGQESDAKLGSAAGIGSLSIKPTPNR